MKALTLYQPWASLIAEGTKDSGNPVMVSPGMGYRTTHSHPRWEAEGQDQQWI